MDHISHAVQDLA